MIQSKPPSVQSLLPSDAKLFVSYQTATKQNPKNSQFELAKRHELGAGVEQNIPKALDLYHEAAEAGHVKAAMQLADYYEHGKHGLKKDSDKAAGYYAIAAAGDEPTASFKLGLYYLESDNEKAVTLFWHAGKLGHAEADYYLAICYEKGAGVEKDFEQAMQYYIRSAEAGCGFAQLTLGGYYYDWEKYQASFKYYQLAAGQQLPSAQLMLGHFYETGDGIEKNLTEAVRYYQLAADQGSAEAQFRLAQLYAHKVSVSEEDNGSPVIEKDEKMAFGFYEQAAEQNHSEACLDLAEQIEAEQGMLQAMPFYEKAAQAGNETAQQFLGDIYSSVQNGKRNIQQALDWYSKAAEQGNVIAQRRLLTLADEYYDTGKESNIKIAFKYYKQLSELCDMPGANLGLAKCYERGMPDEKCRLSTVLDLYRLVATSSQAIEDEKEIAADGIQRMADKVEAKQVKDIDVVFELARCHENGQGVRRDSKKALKFYQSTMDLLEASEKLDDPHYQKAQKAIQRIQKALEKNSFLKAASPTTVSPEEHQRMRRYSF
ncbi:MAG: SEL1-like repeat protein [Gammaproteobacteria bacterium]